MAKSQLKKILKMFARETSKDAASAAKETLDAELRAKNMEEAKKVSTYNQLQFFLFSFYSSEYKILSSFILQMLETNMSRSQVSSLKW